MTPREIIAEAWRMTTTEKTLWRWGFFASFFETLLNIKLFMYQFYFLFEHLRGGDAGLFDIEIAIYNSMPGWFFWTFVIGFVVLVIIELFVPHFATGAIIGLAAKAHRKEPLKGGLVLAMYNFFGVFTAHEVLVFSGWNMALTTCSLILRYIDGSIKYALIWIAIGLWVISNILKFFFSFTEEGIVIQKLGVFTAMGRSTKLIISYLGHVMFLLLLLFIISLRIVVNVLLVFLIPGAAVGMGIILTYFFAPTVSYIIATILGLGLVVLVSYFMAYLHVFKQTVWTITFLELSQKKDLDIIE